MACAGSPEAPALLRRFNSKSPWPALATVPPQLAAKRAVETINFDDMYDEIMLMDEEELVAALAGQGECTDADLAAPSDGEGDGNDAGIDPELVDWDA